jgi:hypothetical protein
MRVRLLLILAGAAGVAVACSEAKPHSSSPAAEISESRPGALIISAPIRAAFIEAPAHDDLVEIKGSGASHALTVNGQPADVAADGTFTAKIHAIPGLNVVTALDGDSRLETPFLFGHFVKPATPIAHAVALDLGSRGIAGIAPDASIESIINLALANRDLVGMLTGQKFSGSMTAADWSFEVTGGHNGATTVDFNSAPQGVNINANINDVEVDGRLSITTLGLTYARDVKVTLARGNVLGDVNLAVNTDTGALTAAMPDADAKLTGFVFDTDNAGFPCCVDSILTGYVQPKIEDAIREGIRTKVPEAVQLTMSGMGVPRNIGFSGAGFKLDLPLLTVFDGGVFDRDGGTITASTRFGGDPMPNTPGATAPGWLQLGQAWGGEPVRAPVLGVSISIDAVNQLMYAAWADGSIAYTAPAPLNAKLTSALPPIVAIPADGVLRVGLGEVLLTRTGADHPMAALTIMQDVAPSGDSNGITLTPSGTPTISVTWLDDDAAGSGLNLVADAARSQLNAFLKPFSFPLPKLPLDALGGELQGQALVVQQPEITIDSKTGRIGASALLKLIK